MTLLHLSVSNPLEAFAILLESHPYICWGFIFFVIIFITFVEWLRLLSEPPDPVSLTDEQLMGHLPYYHDQDQDDDDIDDMLGV